MFALVIGRSNFKFKTKKIVTNFEFFMKAINDFGQKNETLTSKKSNFHQVKTNLQSKTRNLQTTSTMPTKTK